MMIFNTNFDSFYLPKNS